ncbi:MAG TPA: hypothetical protein VJ464_07665 [Blastocatellia bacterium]|nr:hypothetical protein [Blastocatellia bacterium]
MSVSKTDSINKRPGVRNVARLVKQASPRARLLAGVWLLFVLLVAFGIHGSSTGLAAESWMPEKPFTGYLFGLSPQLEHELPKGSVYGLQTLLLAKARFFRWDECFVATPYALSQLAQQPRFPVINPSFGTGQNMLIERHTPVWHVATLARPATWGYFFLGAQRGLAWYWWFQPLACFTALFLLLEVIFNGDWKLAAFGALLFGTSTFVICWSQWPAYFTFFAALACLATYHLCHTASRRTMLISALLLGLSLPGFVMTMYPPWQVPLAYLFLILFAALFVRDGLHRTLKPMLSYRLLFLALAVLLAGGLTLSWLVSCLPAIKLTANTVYPGKRLSVGGDLSFAELFRGVYNLMSSYTRIGGLKNESEAASFYYFFPAVLLALPLSARLRRGLGVVGWALVGYIVAMIFFLRVGVPAFVAKVTLLSYVPGNRADLTLGLASIMLSLYALAILRKEVGAPASRLERWMPVAAAVGLSLLCVIHSLFLLRLTGDFPTPPFALLMAFFLGMTAYLLLAGRQRQFALMLLALQLATTWLINPLATNLDHIYNSELAKEVTRINRQSSERPFWIAYGGVHAGQLIAALGGKAMTGVQWPPRLDIWRALDPDGKNEATYNRYAEIQFDYTNDDRQVAFSNPQEGTLVVKVSPTNPTLKALGTRYVLLMGDVQKLVDTSRLGLIYRSSFDNFSIYEVP